MVDITDLKSVAFMACRFESGRGYQRRVEVAPRLVWVSKSHMMRSDVAVTTKGSMQVCRHVFVVSVKGPSRSYPVLKTPHAYTEISACSLVG